MDLHHANSRVNLSTVDWSKGRQAKTHPFRVRVTPTTIYNQDTGEVVATIAPGYEFYFAHQHPHIAPVGFDTEAAIAEVDSVVTQDAKPLDMDLGTAVMTAMGPRMLPLILAASTKG